VNSPGAARPHFITHPLLAGVGVEHGFGTREADAPENLVRPRQVHGVAVARVGTRNELTPAEADAVVSSQPGLRIGIVTADCVPVLLASASGTAVAAIHAGWKGLASGVVESGLGALLEQASSRDEVVAVIGPHIGRCCYEVDGPVMDPLRARFGRDLSDARTSSRRGHDWLDLGHLVAVDLMRAGIARQRVGVLSDSCTACGADRFHSYRRDGARAGRLLHYIRPLPGEEPPIRATGGPLA